MPMRMLTMKTSTPLVLSLTVFTMLLADSSSSAALVTTQEGAGGGAHRVPLFHPHQLLGSNPHFLETLTSTGLLALALPSSSNEDARTGALGGLCRCPAAELAQLEGGDSITLGDGQTVRSTLATATMGTTPLPLPLEDISRICGRDTAQAMETLRDQVAEASGSFLTALDQLLAAAGSSSNGNGGLPLLRNSYGGSYHTVTSIVQGASNLEHFHIYSKTKITSSEDTTTKPALELHTDAGLFLAFIPAFGCDAAALQEPDQSFYLKDAYGNIQRAVFPPNSVAIMLGAGAEHWLDTTTSASLKLRATRHSVHMESGISRAWYGMMHLVPESAIVEEFPHQRTFGEMREAMILKSHSKTKRRFGDDPFNREAHDVSIGCGFSDIGDDTALVTSSATTSTTASRRRRLQHVENAGACNNVTNFYCWMSCLDIPKQDQAEGYINEGYSLYCVDPYVLADKGKVSEAQEPCVQDGVVGLAMNSNCMGMWQPTAPGVYAQEVIVESSLTGDLEEPWCYGGTSMYMDGFNWLGSTCVIYLFPRFVVDSAGSLVGACLFTIFFGIALEWVIQQRRVTTQKFGPGYARLAVSATFYGLQLSMGYTIMLVVMIYSIPLFISVIVGIVAGHVLFSAPDAIFKKKTPPITTTTAPASCGAGGGAKDTTATNKPGSTCALHKSENLNDDEVPSQGEGTTSCCHGGKADDHKHNKKEEYLPVQVQDLEIPEGSTPCCQNAL